MNYDIDNPEAPNDENINQKLVTQDTNEINTWLPSFASTTRSTSIDLIINREQKREFIKNRGFNNVTIRDNATMTIKNCEFWINGSLKIMGNGKLNIINSTAHIKPGPVGPHEIIVQFLENAQVNIIDSNLYTHPQPTPTNISYLLSDDNSNITIANCYLNLKLPPVISQDISLSPANAGTFILSSQTIWNIQNTTIEAYLKFDENELLEGRWFLFSTLGRSQFFMKNSVGSIENYESQPFLKPVSGFVKLVNCQIRKGVIDNEVVGEVEAINLTIHSLHLCDQSITRMYESHIEDNIVLGVLAVYAEDVGEKSKASLYFENSILGTTFDASGTLLATGNSTSIIIDSSLKKSSIQENAIVSCINSDIEQLIEVKNKGTLTLENSPVSSIFLDGNCDLNIFSNPSILPTDKIISQYNCQAEIELHDAEIRTMEVWPGDNIPPTEYGACYQPNKNVSKLNINMINSTLDKLSSSDDVEISFTLQNSIITDFIFNKFKDEPTIISILDIEGQYEIPEPWPEIDLKILIYEKLNFQTFVNDKFQMTDISVINADGEKIISTETNGQGRIELELLYEQYNATGASEAGEYYINSTFLGISQIKSATEIKNNPIINLKDDKKPEITDVSVHTEYLRTAREIRVNAIIIDSDVKVIANATIYFQYYLPDSGWSSWENKKMIEIENNSFSVELKKLPQGAKIRYYIVANDILGNRVVSNKYMHTIPQTDLLYGITIGSLMFIIIFLIILFFVWRRRKFKKYLNKPKPVENEPRVPDK
jgi:hypothetical protein